MRKHLKNDNPSKIADAPKRGFTVPISHWLNSSLRYWVNSHLDPIELQHQGIFDQNYLMEILNQHNNLKRNNGKKLWTILIYLNWVNNIIPSWKSERHYII